MLNACGLSVCSGVWGEGVHIYKVGYVTGVCVSVLQVCTQVSRGRCMSVHHGLYIQGHALHTFGYVWQKFGGIYQVVGITWQVMCIMAGKNKDPGML